MAFIKRLGWYLVGISIGIVFLTFILKKKSGEEGVDFCYLPNCRVLKDFRSKTLKYSDVAQNQIKEMQLDSLFFKQAFTKGDVDFRKTNTKSKPCKTYFVDYKNKTIKVQNCPNKVTIDRVMVEK